MIISLVERVELKDQFVTKHYIAMLNDDLNLDQQMQKNMICVSVLLQCIITKIEIEYATPIYRVLYFIYSCNVTYF